MAILTTKYYIISESGRYYAGFTANLTVAKNLLEEAKKNFPDEKWIICQFDD